MKTGGKKNYKLLAYVAEEALKEAVAEAIDEHRRNGVPIAIWRNGKIVLVPPARMMVREPQAPKRRIGFVVEEPHVPYKSLKGFKRQKGH